MGQPRLPARRGLGGCVLVLLLLLGGSGSPGTTPPPRPPWAEEQGPGPEGTPVRYEAVKKHLGAVGALSKQYWQYLACKVWQEGCEEGEKQRKGEGETGAILSKHLALFCPCPVPREEQQVRALPFLPQGCCPGSPSLAQPG